MGAKPQTEWQLFAARQAEESIAAIAASPDDHAAHKSLLHDLKLTLCQEAANAAASTPSGEMVWALSQEIPDFDLSGLYRARSSFLSLGVAVFLGWLLGGLLATLLGIIGLGGEILRPATILGALWLEEYLGVNPRARKIMLTILGLGALSRFATALAQGLVRLSGAGGIGRLIFGTGPKPNIFKTAWLWFGAIFLYIFFAKKSTGLDIAVFRHKLEEQIIQRLDLASFFFEQAGKCATAITDSKKSADTCANSTCAVARAAISLLDSLDEDRRKYIAGSLRQAGFTINDAGQDYLIWDPTNHSDQYEPIGLVAQGDRCRILARPVTTDGNIQKGKVQRVDP